MSFRWPNKDPDETLDYSVDWSRWLNGATISTVVWYVDNSAGAKTALQQVALLMVCRMLLKPLAMEWLQLI
jgi:hypothetical protein